MKRKLLSIFILIIMLISSFSNFTLASEVGNASTGSASTLPDASSTSVPADSGEMEIKDSWWQTGLTKFLLAIGDFFNDLITDLLGQKVTIQKFFFDEVDAVNADFFNNKGNSTKGVLKTEITRWYEYFKGLAISIYLAGILAVGIRCLLEGTALSRARAKDVLVKWITGLLILMLFPYVMKYAFAINSALVQAIKNGFTKQDHETGTYIGDEDEFNLEPFEFRSPEYRSRFTGLLTYGGDEVNEAYLKRLNDYTTTSDMMRIMRAYAGVTHRVIFCIIWYILLFQLITVMVKYYKRYFVIALLIAIFPGVMIFYIIDVVKGRNCAAFSAWCREFFVNVFIQTVHAIIYAIIAGLCLDRVREELITDNVSSMNWIIIICSINFIFQGEKVVRKIMHTDASSATALGDSAKKGKEGMKKGGHAVRNIAGMFMK